MSVRCEGAISGARPCRRYGEPNATGEFWCHDHTGQFANLIRVFGGISGGPVTITHNDGVKRLWVYDETTRTASEVPA